MNNNNLKTEWSLLQNQYDSYEKFSLVIKLVSMLVLALALTIGKASLLLLFLLAAFWLQDAIWKTFQSRIESRLLQVEEILGGESEGKAFQLNSDFARNRLEGSALIAEYISQAKRPTVAFPHAALMAILFIDLLL